MTTALSADQRSALEKLVQRARRWIEEDLEAKLAGLFGINPDGRIEDIADLSLSNAQASVRDDLVEIITFLRSEGEGDEGSVARLVREAAFTHTNRLIAVRVAEAIGLLPETISKGTASSGFRDFSELAPTVAATEWGRFAEFLRLCADELAADVPALFDPRNPLLELTLSEVVLGKIVEAISELGNELWAAPDALGWAYQFFNTGEERREMRESSAPRNSRELAVRNQFFTPSYVVEFLVHNGLGAHLAAGFPGLASELPLLVEVPTEQIEVDLAAVSVLDPACGSGHFLLGAYDVLERAWHHAGVGPTEAAPAIVRSLWGVDIDARAAQIAQAAVMFRARRHCRDEKLPAANIICARSLPSGAEIDAFVASLPDHVGRAVKGIAEELVDAPILGPLLKIEQRLDREVRDVFGTGVVEGTLSEAASSDSNNVEAAVLEALSAVADSTTSTASQRLFAAEAHDAVRFVEAMSRRYTAVLMNPPFGEPVASTKDYLKAAYPWLPKISDMLAAFVGRGVELLDKGGSCGAITSRAGFFLATYETWREDVLIPNLAAVADLGYGVMEQALVEAAAYVLRPGATQMREAVYLRLLRERERPAALLECAEAARSLTSDSRVFRVASPEFRAIPRSPVAYWLGTSIRKLFAELPAVESGGTTVSKGTSTSDDFRFVRLRWEVSAERLGFDSASTMTGGRWVHFAKGGEYAPFWLDMSLLVDWEEEGRRIKEVVAEKYPYLKGNVAWVIGQESEFFRPGITWSARTASAFSPRVLPAGTVFGHKGNKVTTPDIFGLLSWLNTRVVAALISGLLAAGDETTSGGASKSYEIGVVRSLPFPGLPPGADVSSLGARLAGHFAAEGERDELSANFVSPPLTSESRQVRRHLEAMEVSADVERAFLDLLSLDDEAARFVEEEVGRHPSQYPERVDLDREIADYWQMPIKTVIDDLIDRSGGHRAIASLSYVANRRLEVIAHGLAVHPKSIVRVVESGGLVSPGESEEQATRFISYLVGLAFGRWDVRIGRDPGLVNVNRDLLAPPPRYSPGSLLDGAGRAATSPPDGYPIPFPSDGLLMDQAGHTRDLAVSVEAACIALADSDEPVAAALAILMKRPSLGGFLRSQFFKQHLSMYSLSRRKAPVFWQLQVPSKTWGLWLYAPRLSREMLFAIVREAEQRQRLAEQQIGHLQREAETGSGGRKASEVAKELEAEQKLAVELASFRAEAERIANLGWEPDLDDGMVLNAAPLADLFPAWKDAAAYRKELRAGKHEWATVARYADQL